MLRSQCKRMRPPSYLISTLQPASILRLPCPPPLFRPIVPPLEAFFFMASSRQFYAPAEQRRCCWRHIRYFSGEWSVCILLVCRRTSRWGRTDRNPNKFLLPCNCTTIDGAAAARPLKHNCAWVLTRIGWCVKQIDRSVDAGLASLKTNPNPEARFPRETSPLSYLLCAFLLRAIWGGGGHTISITILLRGHPRRIGTEDLRMLVWVVGFLLLWMVLTLLVTYLAFGLARLDPILAIPDLPFLRINSQTALQLLLYLGVPTHFARCTLRNYYPPGTPPHTDFA